MNRMEKELLSGFCKSAGFARVNFNGKTVASVGLVPSNSQRKAISFEGKNLAELEFSGMGDSEAQDLAHLLAPNFHFPSGAEWHARMIRVLDWVIGARDLYPEIAHWVGIYQKESFLWGNDSTDLLVGPYLGDVTDHIRIPIDRGFCGLALREERLVNVKDVSADSRHIACSWKTKSELVVPLKNSQGDFVAELDIDSHKLDAFSPSIEASYREYCEIFPAVWG